MAPNQGNEKDGDSKHPDDGSSPELSGAEVDGALVHLARMAAAFGGRSVRFVDLHSAEEIAPDKGSLLALRQAVRILLEDRDRMHNRMTQALAARVHAAVSEAFQTVRSDGASDEAAEEQVASRLQRLGLTLTQQDREELAMSSDEIRENQGPVNAAACAIARTLNEGTARDIFRSKLTAGETPAPAPLRRYVPFRFARLHVNEIFTECERRANNLQPLSFVDALTSSVYLEELDHLLEFLFEAEAREAFRSPEAHRALSDAFFSLLKGDLPTKVNLPPALADAWKPIQAAGLAIGSALNNDPDVLRLLAEWVAPQLARSLEQALRVGRHELTPNSKQA